MNTVRDCWKKSVACWEHGASGIIRHDDTPWASSGAGQTLVVRGGSCYDLSLRARCAYRYWGDPGDYWCGIGFRVVLSLANAGF